MFRWGVSTKREEGEVEREEQRGRKAWRTFASAQTWSLVPAALPVLKTIGTTIT